jgi:hypothetical protein
MSAANPTSHEKKNRGQKRSASDPLDGAADGAAHDDAPVKSKKSKNTSKPKVSNNSFKLPGFDRQNPANLAALALLHPQGLESCLKSPKLRHIGITPRLTPQAAGQVLIRKAVNDEVLAQELELVWQQLERVYQETLQRMNPEIQERHRKKRQAAAELKEELQFMVLFLNRYGARVNSIREFFLSTLQRSVGGLLQELQGIKATILRGKIRLTLTLATPGSPHQETDILCQKVNPWVLRYHHPFYRGTYHFDLGPVMERVSWEIVENNVRHGQVHNPTRTGIHRLHRDVLNHIAGFLFPDRILKGWKMDVETASEHLEIPSGHAIPHHLVRS